MRRLYQQSKIASKVGPKSLASVCVRCSTVELSDLEVECVFVKEELLFVDIRGGDGWWVKVWVLAREERGYSGGEENLHWLPVAKEYWDRASQ